MTVVSFANLHKRTKALARYYVTSHWQAEWVKKCGWKTIESASTPMELFQDVSPVFSVMTNLREKILHFSHYNPYILHCVI